MRLCSPVPMGAVADQGESRMRYHATTEQEAQVRDAEELIDRELDVGLRADYLRMRSWTKGQPMLPASRRRAVQESVRAILQRAGYRVPGGDAEQL
jgi:hypothetical protein